jgi:hypothetical protein
MSTVLPSTALICFFSSFQAATSAWALLGAALLSAGCRSYSSDSVDRIYREALDYQGRDTVETAKRPSEVIWKDVEVRKTLTLGDAYKITLAQSERIAKAAEGFLQSLAVQDQLVGALLPRIDFQGTQFYQDRVPASFTSGLVTTTSSHRQAALPARNGDRHLLERHYGGHAGRAHIGAPATTRRKS